MQPNQIGSRAPGPLKCRSQSIKLRKVITATYIHKETNRRTVQGRVQVQGSTVDLCLAVKVAASLARSRPLWKSLSGADSQGTGSVGALFSQQENRRWLNSFAPPLIFGDCQINPQVGKRVKALNSISGLTYLRGQDGSQKGLKPFSCLSSH